MKKHFDREKAFHLLGEIIRYLGRMEAYQFQRGIMAILPLMGGGRLGEFAFPIFRQLLDILRRKPMDEEDKRPLLSSILGAIKRAGLKEKEVFYLRREAMKIVRTFGEPGSTFLMLQIFLDSSGFLPPEIEALQREVRKAREKLRSSKSIGEKEEGILFPMIVRLRDAGLNEERWELIGALVDAIPKVKDKEKAHYIFLLAIHLLDECGDERVEVMLNRILDKCAKLKKSWRALSLSLLSEEVPSMGIRGSSPIFQRMLEMAKEMDEKGEKEILPDILFNVIKGGAERSLVEKWLQESREWAETPLLPSIESLYTILSLCEEGKFETALERAKNMGRCAPDAFLILASSIAKRLGSEEDNPQAFKS